MYCYMLKLPLFLSHTICYDCVRLTRLLFWNDQSPSTWHYRIFTFHFALLIPTTMAIWYFALLLDIEDVLEDPNYHEHKCIDCCCICCAFLTRVHLPWCTCNLGLKVTSNIDFAMKKRWKFCTCFFKHGGPFLEHYYCSCVIALVYTSTQ
jgi:hypothetical protein